MTWPARPPDGASNLEHALAYHAAGAWVLPGRDPADVREQRERVLRELVGLGWPEDKARAEADRRAARSQKHSFVQWRKLRDRPTEDDLRAWFGARPLRPVILLTGPGRAFCVVDVDVAKGGDPEPWIEDEHAMGCPAFRTWEEEQDDLAEPPPCKGCGQVSLLARTPAGGWHAYHLEANAKTCEGCDAPDGIKTGVAHAVDIRGRGGLVVAPSGPLATPGRSWERWGEPTPFPLEEVNRRLLEREGAPGRGGAAGTEPAAQGGVQGAAGRAERGKPPTAAADREFVPDAPDEGRGATHALLSPAPDGTRNRRAKLIVGMLARRAPLPHDAADAVVATLAEWSAALGVRGDALAVVRSAHEQQARSGERTEAFAVEVVRAWNTLRCRPRWPDDKAEATARSLWASASRGEEARGPRAAPGSGGAAGASAASTRGGVGGQAGEGEARFAEDGDDPGDDAGGGQAGNGPASADDPEALRRFLRPLATLYGPEHLERTLRRELLPCARLPRWLGEDGEPDRGAVFGHGLGELFDEALGGGLAARFFAVLGAESAKAGKSALIFQLLFGLALRSAMVLSGAMSGPVVVPYVLSEMSEETLTHRDLGRWLGVDSSVFRRGLDKAHTAPGLRRLAERLGREPRGLAEEYLRRADCALREGPFARARELVTIVQPRELMGREDHADLLARTRSNRKPVDHRRGVPLVTALADATRADRAAKAKAWGRGEDQILPVWVIDPLQRYQREGDGDAVGALDELVEELRAVADEDEIAVLATSDTNKASAQGQHHGKKLTPYQRAAHVFRGSYKLMHLPDLALILDVQWPDDAAMPARAGLLAALNRWGVPQQSPAEFDFFPSCGRYLPAAPRDVVPTAPVGGPGEQADEHDDGGPQEVEREPDAATPRRGGRFAPRRGAREGRT